MQEAGVALPAEALEAVLEDCSKRGDAELAGKAEALLYKVSKTKTKKIKMMIIKIK